MENYESLKVLGTSFPAVSWARNIVVPGKGRVGNTLGSWLSLGEES